MKSIRVINSNGIELNDSLAIVQYLTNKYPGPLTPTSTENAALSAMYCLGHKIITHLYYLHFMTLLLATMNLFGEI